MNNSLSAKDIAALDKIKGREDLQRYFLKRVKGIKWFDELERRGYFEPSRNPAPAESEEEGYYKILTWNAIDYLEKTADELVYPENHEYIEKFLNVLSETTQFSKDNQTGNYRTWWGFAKILNKIPVENIKEEHMKLCSVWLSDRFDSSLVINALGHKFLTRLLDSPAQDSNNFAVILIEALTNIKLIADGNKKTAKFISENWHIKKILESQANRIGKVLCKDGVDIFKKQLIIILDNTDKDNLSTIWRPAIEDHEQNKVGSDKAENILISALRDALLGFADTRPRDADNYLQEMINDKYILFKRTAIHIISKYFEDLEGLAEKIINASYFKYHFQHELHHFLKECFNDFPPFMKQKALKIIELIELSDEDDLKQREIREAYRKLVWLTAIKETDCVEAVKLYKKYLAIFGKKPSHPDFSSYMESGWVDDRSAYTADEILSMSLDDLIETLNKFEEESGIKKPTIEGLSKSVKEAVKQRPEHFKNSLNKFIDVDIAYIHGLIQGFKDLWCESTFNNWEELLSFIKTLIRNPDFWSGKYKERNAFCANHAWVVHAICDLIIAGTKDDAALSEDNLSNIKDIIVFLLGREEGENIEIDSDAVFISINSSRGKCIEALFNYSLRMARFADKEKNNHEEIWNEVRPIFDAELIKTKDGGNVEFSTLCGNYIVSLFYFNQKWAAENINLIFSRTSYKNWLCAIQGYSYVHKVYREIYKVLRNEGHLKNAIECQDLNEECKRRYIQNIVIAYLQGDEKLDDEKSIINFLMQRWVVEEINEIIWFLWTERKNKTKPLISCALELWRFCAKKIEGKEQENKKMLCKLNMFASFIDNINEETKKLLVQAAPYANIDHDAYLLIEELKRLVDVNPLDVGDIYIEMLSGCTPDFKEEDIIYIVDKLFVDKNGGKDQAIKICDIYLENSFEFLLETHKKHTGTA